jgi:ABC-type glycerol-3-phosphate transport system permease component
LLAGSVGIPLTNGHAGQVAPAAWRTAVSWPVVPSTMRTECASIGVFGSGLARNGPSGQRRASSSAPVALAAGLLNSFIAAFSAGLIATIFGLGAAFCLTRFKFRGRGPYLNSLVGLQSVPGVMIILPLFVMFSSIGSAIGIQIVGTRPALIVTYLTFAIPFATWLLVTYLRQIPISFEEAALLDGLSRFGALRKIIFPLALPGMIISLVFSLLVGWNDVLFASVLTVPATQTVAIKLQVFAATTEGGALPLYGQLMAASLISSAPVVILYMVFQRQLVGGLSAGGEKG